MDSTTRPTAATDPAWRMLIACLPAVSTPGRGTSAPGPFLANLMAEVAVFLVRK